MLHQISANVKVNILFFVRNRLILAMSLVLLCLFGFSILPFAISGTTTPKFQTITQLFQTIRWFLVIFSGLLGLLPIFQHSKDRCIKMIITKPCPLGVWIASIVISGVSILLVAHLVVTVATATLFLAWDIPFQWGVLYTSASNLLFCVNVFTYILLLTVIVSQPVAVMIAAAFHDTLVYHMLVACSAGVETTTRPVLRVILQILEKAFYVGHAISPILNPFSHQMVSISRSLRAEFADLKYLAAASVYTILLGSVFCCLSVILLKRKRHT